MYVTYLNLVGDVGREMPWALLVGRGSARVALVQQENAAFEHPVLQDLLTTKHRTSFRIPIHDSTTERRAEMGKKIKRMDSFVIMAGVVRRSYKYMYLKGCLVLVRGSIA